MNVKPGDLAIIVGPCATPGLTGRVVEILRRAVPGEAYPSIAGDVVYLRIEAPCWFVRSSTPLPMKTSLGRFLLFRERSIQDAILRPISGVPVDDEIIEDLREPA
ncbi:hypothetical protein [Paraburkholderia phenazinium]|uniref:hypothetical protein n=1 Tax=Paraburkholderia phenazinium TaxID=60549 RepID=UPI00115FFF7D|nr:hypothetical protein [Paraburkholderia phenazinium]